MGQALELVLSVFDHGWGPGKERLVLLRSACQWASTPLAGLCVEIDRTCPGARPPGTSAVPYHSKGKTKGATALDAAQP